MLHEPGRPTRLVLSVHGAAISRWRGDGDSRLPRIRGGSWFLAVGLTLSASLAAAASSGPGGITAWTVGGNTRFYMRKARVQPFLLAGLGVFQSREHGSGASDKSTGLQGRAGIGVDLYLTDDHAVSLDVSYVQPSGARRELRHLFFTWGFQWF